MGDILLLCLVAWCGFMFGLYIRTIELRGMFEVDQAELDSLRVENVYLMDNRREDDAKILELTFQVDELRKLLCESNAEIHKLQWASVSPEEFTRKCCNFPPVGDEEPQ